MANGHLGYDPDTGHLIFSSDNDGHLALDCGSQPSTCPNEWPEVDVTVTGGSGQWLGHIFADGETHTFCPTNYSCGPLYTTYGYQFLGSGEGWGYNATNVAPSIQNLTMFAFTGIPPIYGYTGRDHAGVQFVKNANAGLTNHYYFLRDKTKLDFTNTAYTDIDASITFYRNYTPGTTLNSGTAGLAQGNRLEDAHFDSATNLAGINIAWARGNGVWGC